MFLSHQPSAQEINSFITAQRDKPFSYGPIGITRDRPTAGYNVDHNRIQLGSGMECFARAVAAFKRWKMFELGWVHLCWNDTPIEEGSTVAIVVKHLGFWSMNACRIVYAIDESAGSSKFGFAYGTLPGHAELGEESFTVERKPEDDCVWYEILAVSKPGRLASLVYPYSRRLQKQFAQDSKVAMVRAVAEAV